MYTWQQWFRYIQQMHAYIQAQAEKLAELEATVESLKGEMRLLKEQKRVHIDKIEYKFDQLKVETLEGTLNIGITPSSLEDMAVGTAGGEASGAAIDTDEDGASVPQLPKNANPVITPMQQMRGDITRELQQFVDKQIPKHLAALQSQHGHSLDDWHQKMIVDDLRRQLEPRIAYYLQQMEQGASEDQLSSIKDSVIFRTKNDIQAALSNYFAKMPKKDVSEN